MWRGLFWSSSSLRRSFTMKLSTVRDVGDAWMPHTFSSSSSREAVCPGAAREDLEALELERVLEAAHDIRLVLDDEDAFLRGVLGLGHWLAFNTETTRAVRIADRQENLEYRALVRRVLDGRNAA